MFTPKYVEDGRALAKAAQRIIHYQEDLAAPEDIRSVRARLTELKQALKERSRDKVQAMEKALLPLLSKVQPARSYQSVRENVELFVVAIVLALGIRAYYLQPFKIPTGSMQPTLNGVIAHKMDGPPPNILVRTMQFLTLGRSYENIICEAPSDMIVSIYGAKVKRFWDGAIIQMGSGRVYQVGISPEVLKYQLRIFEGQQFVRGQPIVRAYADLGDQLFVDKFSYNLVGPHRGDVFVFRTNGIVGIPSPDGNSQHYIKRLAGLPGDILRIDQPNLFIDGKKADEYPFERVESQKNGYSGYRNSPGGGMVYLTDPSSTVTIPPHNYFALGDNSANSLDSRYWGFVPGQNVVGRGLFVYWPITSHWGFVR